MHFASDAVFTTIHGCPPWSGTTRLCGIHETEEDGFDLHSDNKAILARLLTVKHHSAANRSSAFLRANAPAGGNRGNNMRNLRFNPGNAKYDRIFTLADLKTPGKCFAIITESPNETDRLLQYMRDSSALGDMLVLHEPESPTRALNDMPVVNTLSPLYPVEELASDDLPTVNLVAPQVGQQRYFFLKCKTIRISRLQIMPASCRGVFCDRQQLPNRLVSCGCLFTARAAALVVQFHVTFEYIDEAGNDASYTVTNFRSWRTTKLFVAPITPTTDLTTYYNSRDTVRELVSESVDLVNNNGGWSILGWYRRGEVNDASGNQEAGTEIASLNQPIHMSYLPPTNKTILPAINARRFSPPTEGDDTSNDTTTIADSTQNNESNSLDNDNPVTPAV